MNIRKLVASTAAAALVGGTLVLSMAFPASATTPAEECVPSEAIPAWTEVVPDIEHPAVYETVVITPATEGTPAVWANFSPNDQQATFVGPPTYPTDERGTWHDHGTLPPGQAGPDGVYANGNPDKGGNWFYRQAAVEGTPAVTEERLVSEAYTEVVPDIEHPAVPAVTCEEEPEPVINECTTGVGTHSTNLADLWANVDTRTAGHVEYVENGLHVWTDDASSQAKVSEGIAVNFPLHDTGVLDINWAGTSPAPGINLFVNFGADGNGTLVYESVYGQDLWLTNGSSAAVKANAPVNGGGNGSQWHGTINQWLEKYPTAQVVGLAYSLGSGVKGDGVINSITAGCATHTFDYVAPVVVPEQPEPVVTSVAEEVVNCEAGTVTTTTTTTTIDTEYDAETNTWVPTEPVVETTEETRDTTTEECPLPTPSEEPVPAGGDDGDLTLPPTTQTLAQTGSDNAWIGWSLGGAAALLAGLSLWAFGQTRKTAGPIRSENAE